MNLTPAQIAQVAANAGFSGNDLATAVAIALAESYPSGNASSIGDQSLAPTNGPSYGLWQINTGSHAHPEFAGENLLDPQTNANAAYQIYAAAGGFSPWSTFTSAKYQQYLPAVLAALQPAAPVAPPLTLDASTGQPIPDATLYAAVDPSLLAPAASSAPSFGTVLLWGIVGVFGLWLLEEIS